MGRLRVGSAINSSLTNHRLTHFRIRGVFCFEVPSDDNELVYAYCHSGTKNITRNEIALREFPARWER